ncbi:hypothetical protein [Spirosoma utsteinense]|uniref:Uncharacterized protein n=1 Tax=Spirosoma utsteinense TaxID=2585773 RepID=A0ABR6W865_9BACT|nr:hypothetical protein [Spirosoma utsteinense]MBC3784137.1 hypothetical protein [Spirosoma utsteinense]MBC3792774.1 hypothetical protein [Spirosoma utsteinense]
METGKIWSLIPYFSSFRRLAYDFENSRNQTKDLANNAEFFKNLTYWTALSGERMSIVLYAGNQLQKRSNGMTVMKWRDYAETAK